MNIQELQDKAYETANHLFGTGRNGIPQMHHLKEECDEVIEAITIHNKNQNLPVIEIKGTKDVVGMEYADCLLLLLDSAANFGFNTKELIEYANRKLEINKKRNWGKPDENGVIKHI